MARTGQGQGSWGGAGAGSVDSLGFSSSEYLPDASDCYLRIAALNVGCLFVVYVQVSASKSSIRILSEGL